MNKLDLRNATLGYDRNPILKNVSLELYPEKTVCIIGKNGAGKTTLFKSILGIIPSLSGEILLNGKSIRDWRRSQFAQIVAYVPQAHTPPFPFSAFEVVLFGRTAHLSRFSSPGKKDKLIAEECLDLLNISYLKNRIFTELSGGEQQMIIVARALAQQPSFLIMDEPTSNLDFGNQIKIIRQINSLKNRKIGILMATHSPDHAYMCDADVVVVHNSEIWKQGYCEDTITEEVLKEIYGVNISVCTLYNEHNGGRKICIPRD